MQRLITDRIFASSLDCTYKSFLQLNGHHETKSEYEEHTEYFDSMYRISALALKRSNHYFSALTATCASSAPNAIPRQLRKTT